MQTVLNSPYDTLQPYNQLFHPREKDKSTKAAGQWEHFKSLWEII